MAPGPPGGRPDVVLDHMAMLNRRAGNGGAGWHAHDRGVRGREVEGGLAQPDPAFLENSQQVVPALDVEAILSF